MTPREQRLVRLRNARGWDVVVIGGGATGLGTAVDAASRGYRTLLLERDDFARGTSSRSTKLIHGGVRYLAQGRVGLVREALAERERLLGNAPHLVHSRAFLVPAYGRLGRAYYGAGLWLYDRLARADRSSRSRVVGRDEALRMAPTLRPNGLRGGVVYQDGQFDDARLAVALMRTIDDHGGTALNRVRVVGLEKDGLGKVAGVRAVDVETGEVFRVGAKVVVNASGVFVDDVRRLDEPTAAPMVAPSRGAHLVLGREFLPGETAVLVPKTDDGRVIFAIPWHDRVVVGTTDTPVKETAIEPEASRLEIDFLLSHAGRYFSKAPTAGDVLSVFAGLRPLIGGRPAGRPASLSRGHVVTASASGLVTITGGKWTTYRRMAEDGVDLAGRVGLLPVRPCVTRDLRLHGWSEGPADGPLSVYGSDAAEVLRIAAARPGWSERLDPRLPYIAAEVIWAAREEAASTVEDVLSRRTRALLLDARAAVDVSPFVAELMAEELGRGGGWVREQVEEFAGVARHYLIDG